MFIGKIIDNIVITSQIFRSYPLCHSRPDRSFCYNGRYFGLCARCTMMYLGGLLTILLSPLWKPVLFPTDALVLGILSLLPGGIDGTTQMFGNRESNNRLRSTTGFLLGIGVVLCVYAMVHLILISTPLEVSLFFF